MHSIVVLCIASFFSVTAAAVTTTSTYHYSAPVVSDWHGYSDVELPGLPRLNVAGAPLLPVHTVTLVAPVGKIPATAHLDRGEREVLDLSSPLRPGSHVHPLSAELEGPIPLPQPDPAIYGAGAAYPQAEPQLQVQYLAGHRVVFLNLYPVRYLPAEQALEVATELTLSVTWQDEVEPVALPRRNADLQRLRALVDNPDDLLEVSEQPGDASADYLIVTNRALADASVDHSFQDLLAAHSARGLSGAIVLTEDIAAAYQGKNLAEKIRAFLTHAYRTLGTRMVLLGGDADDKQLMVVPAVGFIAEAEGYTDKTIPADLYYGCLDGDFDFNKNGILGEPTDGPDGKEVDLLCELAVGRAPIDSAAELDQFVRKTLLYLESGAELAYRAKVLMVGEYLWTSNKIGKIWGGDHMDQLVGGSDAFGIITTGIPLGATFQKLYEKNNTFTTPALLQAIREGAHYINHLGHSSLGMNMKLTNSSITGLGNEQRPFLGYTQGCYAGAFDNKSHYGSVSSTDAILENLVSSPTGAFAYLGNSRYGWGDDHSLKGPSHLYHRQFWHGRFGKGLTRLGELNHFSKEQNLGLLAGTAMRWVYYQLTLFGDPALPLHGPVAAE